MNRRSTGRRASWLLAAGIARYVGQLLLLAIIARAYGVSTVGIYSLALAITTPIFVILGLGMRPVYLTLSAPPPFQAWMRVQTASALLAVLLSVGLSLALGGGLTAAILLVSVSKGADLYSDFFSGSLQKNSKTSTVTWLSGLHALLTVVAAATVAFGVDGSVNLLLAAVAAVRLVATFLVSLPIVLHAERRAAPHVPGDRRGGATLAIVKAGAATGLAAGLLSLVSAVPQYTLALFSTTDEVGQFAVLLYAGIALEIVLNALSQAWIPDAKQMAREGRLGARSALRLSLLAASAGIVIGVPVLAAARWVIPAVFGSSFEPSAGHLVPLAVYTALAPAMFLSSTVLTVLNRYTRLLQSSFLTVAFCVVASAILVPSHSSVGALWATALTLAFRAAANLLQVPRQTAHGISVRPGSTYRHDSLNQFGSA